MFGSSTGSFELYDLKYLGLLMCACTLEFVHFKQCKYCVTIELHKKWDTRASRSHDQIHGGSIAFLLAPTGALVLMMVYYISGHFFRFSLSPLMQLMLGVSL